MLERRAPRPVVAILLVAELVIIGVTLAWKRLDGLDLEVYRLGAEALLTSGDPYGPLLTSDGTVLPFTYPPFAALAFAPLLVLPLDTVLVALTVVSVLALGGTIGLCLASVEPRLRVAGGLTLLVQAVALVSEPVRATLGFGQVNLLLMLLVAVDLLSPMRRWPRGALLGLAAAVKLTPAAFVLFFLLRKDFRAAAKAMLVFGGCVLVAWLLAPSASAHYWTELLFAGERIGEPGYIANQSLRGLLARLGPPGETLLWLAAVLVTVAVTAWLMHRALAARQPVRAVLICAFGALLASPVSWTHHWVWLGPALGVLGWAGLAAWRAGRRTRAVVLLGSAAVVAAVFLVSPLWDHRDVWPLRESYVLAGVLLLGLLAKPFDDPLHAAGERGDVVRLDGREEADP